MKASASLLAKVIRLAKGEALGAGALKGEVFARMIEEGVLRPLTNGSRVRYRAVHSQVLRGFMEANLGIDNLEEAYEVLSQNDASRSQLVRSTGDSKYRASRSFTGFLVTSFSPVEASLAGKRIVIDPPPGSFLFIADYQHFAVDPDVVIVGVENAENFRCVSSQKYLFEGLGSVLFVSRYPQQQSKDLLRWLMGIPNRYVHFGDLDLAGINIYQTEFYARLGERASFLLPPDFRQRLSRGSRERYDVQLPRFGNLHLLDARLQPLVDAIHELHRGYDQEGFILPHDPTPR